MGRLGRFPGLVGDRNVSPTLDLFFFLIGNVSRFDLGYIILGEEFLRNGNGRLDNRSLGSLLGSLAGFGNLC